MKAPNLRRIKIENFKAIQNSGSIKLSSLTVFIGNNGSDKSSIIEGLLTYQMIIQQGLDDAINYWRGFDYIRNRAVPHTLSPKSVDRPYEINPVTFKFSYKDYTVAMNIPQSPNGEVFISDETIDIPQAKFIRDITGSVTYELEPSDRVTDDIIGQWYLEESPNTQGLLSLNAVRGRLNIQGFAKVYDQIADWQFINFNPAIMGDPIPPRLSADQVKLAANASNLGHYLLL